MRKPFTYFSLLYSFTSCIISIRLLAILIWIRVVRILLRKVLFLFNAFLNYSFRLFISYIIKGIFVFIILDCLLLCSRRSLLCFSLFSIILNLLFEIIIRLSTLAFILIIILQILSSFFALSLYLLAVCSSFRI